MTAKNSFAELRRFGESFVRTGSVRRGDHTKHSSRLRNLQNTDPWAFNDKQVQTLLLRSFPNQKTNPRQRDRMQTWAFIIYRYFRAGDTARTIAGYFLEKKNKLLWEVSKQDFKREQKRIEHTIRRIRKVASGLNSKGETRKRIGRPRKTNIVF
jgi:hypothetical protein